MAYLNGGEIQTIGNQIYNDKVVLGANTTLNTTGSAATVSFSKPLNGNMNVNVNSNASGSNTLMVDTGDIQTWNISGSNSGAVRRPRIYRQHYL